MDLTRDLITDIANREGEDEDKLWTLLQNYLR